MRAIVWVVAVALLMMPAVQAWTFVAVDGTTHSCHARPRDGGSAVRVRDFYSDDPAFCSTDYAAFATYDERGRPIVHLSEQRMSVLSSIAQKFIFYHECAHLWTRDESDARELSANCAALRHMRRNGIVGHGNAVELRTFIRGLPARLPLYPDGKVQWDRMRDCR